MPIVTTLIEWDYKPADLFEVPVSRSESAYDLELSQGRATATLKVPQDPVPMLLKEAITTKLQDILRARAWRTHRSYLLMEPAVRQIDDLGRNNITITVHSSELVITGDLVDIVHMDANGNIIGDTKRQRVHKDEAFNQLLEQAASKDSLARAMIESCTRSVEDPENELVHLYEVRDALRTRYGTIGHARSALQIPEAEWKRFDELANNLPIREGRHRGKDMPNLRPATQEELVEARAIIMRWLEAFARAL